MISVICAPIGFDPYPPRAQSWPKAAPTSAPAKIHPIIQYLLQHHRSEISRWTLISALEPDRGGPRAELRMKRSRLFRQLDELVRVGHLEKVDRHRVRLKTLCR